MQDNIITCVLDFAETLFPNFQKPGISSLPKKEDIIYCFINLKLIGLLLPEYMVTLNIPADKPLV